MKIIIGSDQNGFALKNVIIEHLTNKGVNIKDMGVYNEDPVDYPDIAEQLALTIAHNEYERGILICGTGVGMAIVANKVPGVRAACAHDVYSAERARKSNDAQILTMGSLVIGVELAKSLVDAWVASEFAGGRSAPKVEKIKAVDVRYRKLDDK